MKRLKLGFNGLEHLVEIEYERKGYTPRRAARIGLAVAGKVATRQRKRRKAAGQRRKHG